MKKIIQKLKDMTIVDATLGMMLVFLFMSIIAMVVVGITKNEDLAINVLLIPFGAYMIFFMYKVLTGRLE